MHRFSFLFSNVLLNHLIRDGSGADSQVPAGPKVPVFCCNSRKGALRITLDFWRILGCKRIRQGWKGQGESDNFGILNVDCGLKDLELKLFHPQENGKNL
jgi:hypothetical protein